MPLKLIIANKAYSSWSLRPWILMTHFKIPFEEVVIPLDHADTREKLLAYSPSGKAPALVDGDVAIWESLAIIEYLAEKYPKRPIWPQTRPARALARALAAEMHAGFQPLRAHLPTNFRRAVRRRELTPESRRRRRPLEAAWASTRRRFGRGGPFLFGPFSPPTRCSPLSSTGCISMPSPSRRRPALIWTRSWRCRRGSNGKRAPLQSTGASNL